MELSIKEEIKDLVTVNEINGITELTIKDNSKKLSDILHFLPNGIIDKSVTGIGATTLEIKAKRNSIIVVPLKIIASSKTEQHKENCYYVGSEIGNFGKFDKDKFKAFYNNKAIESKKIIVVAESLPKLIKIIEDSVYEDYFLMIDEINSIQEDSKFRNNIERCLDYYLKFPKDKRALVSATLINFSHPELKEEPRVTIKFSEIEKRIIKYLIFSDNELGVCIDVILTLLKHYPTDKIVIAYSSVGGSIKIIEKLIEHNETLKDNISLLCSKNNKEKAGKYFKELSDGNYPSLINFITAAYFSGYDINHKYHLISLVNGKENYTNLSFKHLKQISGRGRMGLLSENLIYPIIFDTKKDEIKVESLIEAANAQIASLKCINKHLKNFTFLKNTINNIREAVVKEGNVNGYKLVRKDINFEYQISYFNIDSFIESQHTRLVQQASENTFIQNLLLDVNIDQIDYLNSSFIVKLDSTQRKKESDLSKLVEKLLDYPTEHDLKVIYADSTKLERQFITRYSKTEKFFQNKKILIDKLLELINSNETKFSNFWFSIAYKSLPENSKHRLLINALFIVNEIYSPDYIQVNLNESFALYADDIYFKTPSSAVGALKLMLVTEKRRNKISENGFEIISHNKTNYEDSDGFLENVLVRDDQNPFMPI